jgi:hypothetical protein
MTPESNRPSKLRSPAYPFIGLEEALARARTLFDNEQQRYVKVDVAVGHWGYSAKSSGGHQTIAALRAFNLLEGDGSVRLTERAVQILGPGGPHQASLIRRTALAPPIYATLWERYKNDLPPDQALSIYLTRELGFNPGSVDGFLRAYKATLSFAQLQESAGYGPEIAQAPSEAPVPHLPDFTLRYPLRKDNWVELRVLQKIDPSEAAQIRMLVETWLETITDRS